MSDERPDVATRFQKGNRFWEARSSYGRPPTFATSDDLWKAAVEYFEWVDANPLEQDQVTFFKGVAIHEPVKKMRAMTIGGLCNFLGITQETWRQYRDKPDYSAIAAQVDQIIRQQKFEGASAEMLNANIIARELGLADKRDLSSSDGTMTPQVTTFALPDNGRGDRSEG